MVSRFVLVILLLAIGGCGAPVPRGESGAPTPPAAPPPTPPEPPQQEPDGSADAIRGLLMQARDARRQGSFLKAESLLQRAQRIAPREAGVYLEYARLYDSQGESERASAMAERGLLYCRGRDCEDLRRLVY